MVLATVTHHSFQVGTAHDGLRAQKTVTSTREVEERVPHAGLRAQKAPPPGMRPGVLQDPAPQGRVGQHSGIGYELVLALDAPVLQMVEHTVDNVVHALLIPERPMAVQVIEVPKISATTCPPRSLIPVPQLVEQLVEVPTVLSVAVLQQRTAEKIIDIAVPRREGARGGFSRFLSRTGFNYVSS